jgi:hypothetical protein
VTLVRHRLRTNGEMTVRTPVIVVPLRLEPFIRSGRRGARERELLWIVIEVGFALASQVLVSPSFQVVKKPSKLRRFLP